MLVAALVVAVAVLGVAPEVVSGQSTLAIEPATIRSADAPSAQRVAAPPTTITAVTVPPSTIAADPVPLEVRVVADPRPGDLRVDDGDVLPSGYTAVPATEVVLDLEYGPDPAHRYDLYLPSDDHAPLVLFLHSGGWIGGSRAYVPEMVLRYLDLGYAVASVEYRVAPDSTFPGPVEDVKRAIRELKAMGTESGLVDPERFVLYGTSAGGHLGVFAAATVGEFEPTDLTTAATAFDSSVAAVVSVVGPTDLVQLYSHPNAWAAPMSGTFMDCFPTCTAEQLRPANPGDHLDGAIPPAYWAYGAHDPLVNADAQGAAIAEQWAHAGAESWLDIVDDGDHNLDETLVNQRALERFMAGALGFGLSAENVNDR